MKTKRSAVYQILMDGPYAGTVYEGLLGERTIYVHSDPGTDQEQIFRYQLTACTPKHCIMQYVYVP